VLEAFVPLRFWQRTRSRLPGQRRAAAGGFVMIGMGTRPCGTAENIPPYLPTTALVVDGIYGRTRNPLYLGTTLVYLGLSVAAGSLWAIGWWCRCYG